MTDPSRVPTFKAQKFIRKPFPVDAARVTDRNMADMAKWCNGEIVALGEHDGRYGPYIQVKVNNPLFDRQTQAYVGDWVLLSPSGGFKVYTDSAFRKSFEPMLASNSPQLEYEVPNGQVLQALQEKFNAPKQRS